MAVQAYHKVIEGMNDLGRRHTPFLFIINYAQSEGHLIEYPLSAPCEEVSFCFHGVGNVCETAAPPHPIRMERSPMRYDDYKRAFDVVRAALMRGDSFLCNLTATTDVSLGGTLSDIYAQSRAPYRLLLPRHFVSFSPESFVRIDPKGRIATYPMKGTMDATLPHAEQSLMDNAKEQAEHYTIVDLLRSDLSRVATDVVVDRFRYIDRIKTSTGELLQTSSEISGQLPDDWHSRIGSIIDALLPAGSITGAPKRSTCETIKQAEQYDRDYYTGVAGYYDGKSLDSCVLIRYIGTTPEGAATPYRFYSGGGITIHSTAESEYDELIEKVYLPIPSC